MSFELVCDAPYERFTYNGWYDLVMSIPIVSVQTMVVPTAYKIQKGDYSRLPVRGKFDVLSAGLVKLATKAVTSYKKALEREAKELAKTSKMETKAPLDKRIDLSSESGLVVKFYPSLDENATVYSDSIIGTMARFHEKRKLLKNVDACFKWIVAQAQRRSVAVDRVDEITSALRGASVYDSIKIRDEEVCTCFRYVNM
ncbi:hypothetical protein DVH05_006522 [Phytophthora capsici]|nr:hypothetical protein DVH05_012505 [Phytophthora capsici]KAG1686482.1 hypothetical protein DVH05_006522 [Phytophthora capsici]